MKKGSMAINFDGIEINGVKYKYWDEKTKKDFWEGFESNTLGNPNKYPYYSSTSSNTGSNGNDHWTDKFNIGDPDEDEGHWVTLKNHKHIFIKDNDGQQRTSSSSNAKSYNSSNYTFGSDNRKRTEEHIARKQKELEEDNKRRIANKEVNKKSTGETGGAVSVKNKHNKNSKNIFLKLQQINPEVLLNNRLNELRPDTKKLANIFIIKPKNKANDADYYYIKPGYAETINSKYGLSGTNKEIGKNWSGFVFYKGSSLSKNLSASLELQKQIQNKYNFTKKEFLSTKLEVSFNDPNLKLALGNATIINPKIDKNGYFYGILFDLYDFKLEESTAHNDFLITTANDYFWYKQQRDFDRNFYILVPVIFKWEQPNEKS